MRGGGQQNGLWMLFPRPINTGDIQQHPHPPRVGKDRVGAHVPLEVAVHGPCAMRFRSPTLRGRGGCPGTPPSSPDQPLWRGKEQSRAGGGHLPLHTPLHVCAAGEGSPAPPGLHATGHGLVRGWGVAPGTVWFGSGHGREYVASKRGADGAGEGDVPGSGQSLALPAPGYPVGNEGTKGLTGGSALRSSRTGGGAAWPTAPHHTHLPPGLSINPPHPWTLRAHWVKHQGGREGGGDTEARPWAGGHGGLWGPHPPTALRPFPPQLSTPTPPRGQALTPLLLATPLPIEKCKTCLDRGDEARARTGPSPPSGSRGGSLYPNTESRTGLSRPPPRGRSARSQRCRWGTKGSGECRGWI